MMMSESPEAYLGFVDTLKDFLVEQVQSLVITNYFVYRETFSVYKISQDKTSHKILCTAKVHYKIWGFGFV